MWDAALGLPFFQQQRKQAQVVMPPALIFALVEHRQPTLG
jgi:hypothetical protein